MTLPSAKFSFVFVTAASTLFAGADDKFAERYPRYRLQANDVIEVQFRYTPEYNTTVTVQPDGYVSLQMTGDVHVAGETILEVARQVEKEAAAKLRDPEVTVVIKDFVKPHYIVAGEVIHPGTFDLRGDVTAVQAIATGGGFKESAKHSHVILIRRVNKEWGEVKVLDMKQMMQTGQVLEDVLLQPDDIILVPQSVASKMERYIRWASVAAYAGVIARP